MSPAMPWHASVPESESGPRIALIHGLMAGRHMERHLLTFLRKAGFVDTTLYSNHERPAVIARDLEKAVQAGRPIVLIGYSQGGIQVLKVARHLAKKGIQTDLVISIAAGGFGRIYPPQWGFNVRRIPAGIKRYLNYFSQQDLIGGDRFLSHNLARAESSDTHLENIHYPKSAKLDHFEIVRCYPAPRVVQEVRQLFLERVLSELSRIGEG
jgi:pimeloyl-ACP methyl ester carboxylesterase